MNIKNRNIIVSIILSIVTCGIYAIYWGYCMGKEALSLVGEEDTLTAVLCGLLPFLGFFLLERKLTAGYAAQGVEHKDNSILYLILGLVPYCWIVVFYMVQSELNKVANA